VPANGSHADEPVSKAMKLRTLFTVVALLLLPAGCDSPSAPPEPPPAAVFLSAPDSVLRVDRTLRLSVDVRDALDRPLQGAPVAWTTSDTAVAVVSSTGEVTGVRAGTVTVSAASGKVSASVALRVYTPVAFLVLPEEPYNLTVGSTRRVEVAPRDSAGRSLPGVKVRYESDDPSVAVTTVEGVVTALAPGVARLQADAEGVRGHFFVQVTRAYDVVSLGTLGGGASRALGLNERGEVVGEAQTASGAWRAFLWRDGGMVELRVPGGSSRAVAVNGSGTVVGVFRPGSDTTGSARPFLWSAGSVTQLAPSHPADHVYATDINDRGQVVGYSATSCASCPFRSTGSALLWEDGEMKDLGSFGGQQGIATAIDELGRIAGGVQPQDSAVLLAGGITHRIFPGIARAMSGAGHVVGDARMTNPLKKFFFIWRDGATYPMSIFPWDDVRVAGVDADGKVAGLLVYGGATAPPPEVVVRQPNSSLPLLRELLAPGTPWRVEGIGGMNDRGEMAGWGRHVDGGEVQALLLKPRA